MGKIQTLIIPGELPGLNQTVGSAKSHWALYYKQKREAEKLIAWSAKEQKIKPVKRAAFSFDWYCKNFRRDPDNVAGGGTKIIMDALQVAGVIENDGHKQVSALSHRFFKDAENPRVEVTIQEQKQ